MTMPEGTGARGKSSQEGVFQYKSHPFAHQTRNLQLVYPFQAICTIRTRQASIKGSPKTQRSSTEVASGKSCTVKKKKASGEVEFERRDMSAPESLPCTNPLRAGVPIRSQ